MGEALRIEGLVKSYGPITAVDGVSLSVGEGEVFGFLGPNGAGKTTTIRSVMGLVGPDAGRIEILGRDVAHDLAGALAEVGYLPDEFALWPSLTGRECLDYLGSLHPRPPARAAELCERFELTGSDLDRQVRRYSRGMKQKLGIVQAFQHGPRLVIADEPTGGLDPLMRERFVGLVAEHARGGGTVFLSSHVLSEVEEATDRVAVIRAGRIVRTGPTRHLTGERLRHCTLVLREPLPGGGPPDLPSAEDVVADPSGTTFRFEHSGDMGALLRAVADLPVIELLVEPERLSEAFFEVYRSEA
ncbi:MAG: ABC transporter ATP-binding protein [Actinobacteria bacterium]|nr:ABC transporter ATP-binding protein [Actinomycetota bacterium]